MITFNEWLENISTSIIELANIDKSSQEEAIVIFITKSDPPPPPKTVVLQNMTMDTALSLHIYNKLYILIIIDSWSLGGEDIHITIMNKFKQGILYFWIMHMVYRNHLYKE